MYIGSSKCVPGRWGEHFKALTTRRSDHKKLQDAWSREGPEAFEFVVLEVTSPEDRRERELDHLRANVANLFNAAIPGATAGRVIPPGDASQTTFTPEESARYLGLGMGLLDRLVRAGKIAVQLTGPRRFAIPRAELDRFLAG